MDEAEQLPQADMMIANLAIEYELSCSQNVGAYASQWKKISAAGFF